MHTREGTKPSFASARFFASSTFLHVLRRFCRSLPLFARWPIRNKLLWGVTLLLVPIATLSVSTLYSCYAYRGLVRSLGQLDELRLVNELVRRVNEVRLAACDLSRVHYDRSLLSLADDEPPPDVFELRHQLNQVRDVLGRYREQLE